MRPGFALLTVTVAVGLSACSPPRPHQEAASAAVESGARQSGSEIVTPSQTSPLAPPSALVTHQADARPLSRPAGTALAIHSDVAAAKSIGLPNHMREERDREIYGEIAEHGIIAVAEQPVSTFGIDVDTTSYANVRRLLNEGRLPPHDAVRVEELINYFRYDDPLPESRDRPFRVATELATTPWNPQTSLLRIGIRASDIDEQALPPSNLVFLIDVSGSMNQRDKLPLLKRSLSLLTKRLDAEDRVTLVVYAGAAGVVLEPTPGNERAKIENALNALQAGGSTHGSAGISLAYAKAREAFIDGGINRVILATDGDFNVGTVDHHALINLVERERNNGVALTTLGFGRGNLNDHLMEQLADHGNGNSAYIDSLLEAQKVLVEQIGGTLYTVASDVKIQVEFNPARVAEYRLIGYENRQLRREDFNNDRIDAGDLGAGHRVVALYEISEHGSDGLAIDPLRYGSNATETRPASNNEELAYVKLRYKPRGSDSSELIAQPVTAAQRTGSGSEALRFAAAVAAFGQKMRGGDHLGDYSYEQIKTLAGQSRGGDREGHRAAFLQLVALANALNGTKVASQVHAGD